MERKDWDYLTVAALFLCGLYVAITGLVADVFGFPRIALHSTLGYACVGLATLHVVLNWRQVRAHLRRRFRPHPRRERPEVAPAERPALLSRRHLLISGLAAVGGFALGRLIPRRQGLPDGSTDLGELYHQWSKLGVVQALEAVLDWGGQPARYKSYLEVERVALPTPLGYQGLSLEKALEARRSVRNYSGKELSAEELSRLLHAAQGITAWARGFRAAPSAGALYPIELYVVAHNVKDLGSGIYHYAVREHELELVEAGDFRAALTRVGLMQGFLGQANVCFVLSAIFQRTRWRYHERAYRYVMLEAGHVGQNLYLAATSMGLGACAVGVFLDDELNGLLGLDGGEETALYVISVGTL